MSEAPRIVIDTNVWISFLFWKSSPLHEAVKRALRTAVILRSTDSDAELAEVVMRKKFDDYLSLSERELFLAFYRQKTNFIAIRERIQACRDPKDDKFLELAVSGNAQLILTGDQDLLALKQFRTIQLINPASLTLD